MAASAWTIFERAKHNMAIGTINLSADNFRLSLHRTSISAVLSISTVTLFSEITDECSGGGYTAQSLAGVAWTNGASAGQQKWDVTDPIFTASLSTLSAVRYAVIWKSASAGGGPLLAYAALSTAEFNVTTGNTLTIQMAATGVFTLT